MDPWWARSKYMPLTAAVAFATFSKLIALVVRSVGFTSTNFLQEAAESRSRLLMIYMCVFIFFVVFLFFYSIFKDQGYPFLYETGRSYVESCLRVDSLIRSEDRQVLAGGVDTDLFHF